jgi:SAM-dependent methyltransferase
VIVNDVFRRVRTADSTSVQQVAGSGHDVPFKADSFDVVLCLEVLEHIPHPERLGLEIMRVLKPGGLCMLMTPARVKWLFRPDPHFGIRGLLLLPDKVQQFVVRDLLRRTREYDVEHTFWTLRGIKKLFPDAASVAPLFNASFPFTDRSRLYNRLWWNLLWDRIVVYKAARDDSRRLRP